MQRYILVAGWIFVVAVAIGIAIWLGIGISKIHVG